MTSVGIPAWKRAVAAHAEECYSIQGRDMERSIHWFIDGFVGDISEDAQKEIQRQLAAGERCSACLTGYPARVGPGNISEIMRSMEFGPLREQAMTMLAQGRCGICGHEVSGEYFAAQHVKDADRQVFIPGGHGS